MNVASGTTSNRDDHRGAGGCSLHGHVVTLTERLGVVSTAVQRIAEGGPETGSGCREHLVEQLAELAANAVVMLVESSKVFSSTTEQGDQP